MIDLEKMAKEHEALFEHCDLESQLEKLEEEKDEVREAFMGYVKELADVLIVCAGIYRFDKEKAIREMKKIYGMAFIMCITGDDLDQEVNRKWLINLKRKWEWNGKTYHHIGEDE